MTINPLGTNVPVAPSGDARKADSPEEAARQFEAVLVRQFVQVMTDGLFEDNLAGEGGPGWMKSQQDTQREVMTDVLTQHLVESRSFRIADLLMKRWQPAGAVPEATPEAPAEASAEFEETIR